MLNINDDIFYSSNPPKIPFSSHSTFLGLPWSSTELTVAGNFQGFLHSLLLAEFQLSCCCTKVKLFDKNYAHHHHLILLTFLCTNLHFLFSKIKSSDLSCGNHQALDLMFNLCFWCSIRCFKVSSQVLQIFCCCWRSFDNTDLLLPEAVSADKMTSRSNEKKDGEELKRCFPKHFSWKADVFQQSIKKVLISNVLVQMRWLSCYWCWWSCWGLNIIGGVSGDNGGAAKLFTRPPLRDHLHFEIKDRTKVFMYDHQL